MESRREGHDADYRRGARSSDGEHMGESPDERRDQNAEGYSAFRERAAEALEEGRRRMAEGMGSLGDRLEEQGDSMAGEGGFRRPLGRAMKRTGGAVGSGADYLREHQVDAMGDDVIDAIREHPLLSVGLALGAGFVIGRLLAGTGGAGDWDSADWADEDDEALDESDEELQPRARRRRRARRTTRRGGGSGGLRRELGRAVISSVAALAVRQLRERIAGAQAPDEELEEAPESEL